jgi:DNA-binding beta-propeller fold protein YncE
LYLDDQLVIESTVPEAYVENFITLEPGLHDLRITYQDRADRSQIYLYWTRPGGEKEIIPTQYLWPSRAAKSTQDDVPTTGAPPPVASLGAMELIWQATWGTPGDGEGQFWEPRDVAVMGDTVFVADTGNRRVQALDRDGAFRSAWSGGQEPFEEPLALGVDSRNRLLVLDSLPGWIYRFDAEGTPLDRFAGPASQTFHPRGMTVLEDDTVMVADTGGARLVFFDPAGNVAGRLGALGGAPGQLSDPVDVAMDGAGTYLVAEARNQRIQRLDRQGNSLDEWPILPSVAYDGPHLAWAPDGSLLVTAPADGAILRYAPDGRLLNRWGQAASVPLRQPVGIYLDAASSTLFVTDTATHQVHVFRIEQRSE